MDIFVTTAAAVVVVGGGLLFLRRRKGHGLKEIPGPTPWPIVGNVHQFDKNKLHVACYQWMQTYGDLFQFVMFGSKYLMLNSREVLESGMVKFPRRPYHINRTINYDGKGVAFCDNDLLKEELKKTVAVIAKDRNMQQLFNDEIVRLVEELRASKGKDVFLNKAIEKSIMTQMMILILGVNPTETEHKAMRVYLDEVKTLFRGGRHFILSAMPWLRFVPGPFKTLYATITARLADMIKAFTDKIQIHATEGADRGLIEKLKAWSRGPTPGGADGVTADDENVYASVVDSVNGSVGPWYQGLVAMLLCILMHAEVQEKAHAELDSVCKGRPPTDDDRSKLPYLNAVVLEGLRYVTILTTTVPHTATEDTDFEGYFVEKDTHIFANMCNLHHNEDVWGDGWTFRPERFLDESGRLLPTDHLLRKNLKPFGFGPRSCSGYALAEPYTFKYIAAILYHFKVMPPTEGELPDYDPRTFGYAGALIVPEVNCRFEPRTVNS